MSKQSQARRTAADQRAQQPDAAPLPNVNDFSVSAWRADLAAAATDFETGAKRLLTLALAARGRVEEDTAREAFQDAFAGAMVTAYDVTDADARKSKSCMNRVADAMAVFKAPELPASMPGNLQRAADAIRKAKREAANDSAPGGQRKPRPGKPQAAVKDPRAVALGMLHAALEQLRHAVGDDAAALDAVGDLVDLVDELEEALGVQAKADGQAAA